MNRAKDCSSSDSVDFTTLSMSHAISFAGNRRKVPVEIRLKSDFIVQGYLFKGEAFVSV